jgi:hypothetical protein
VSRSRAGLPVSDAFERWSGLISIDRMAGGTSLFEEFPAVDGIWFRGREEARKSSTSLQNGAVERKPAFIAACSNTNQVRAMLLVAQASGLPVSVPETIGSTLFDGPVPRATPPRLL